MSHCLALRAERRCQNDAFSAILAKSRSHSALQGRLWSRPLILVPRVFYGGRPHQFFFGRKSDYAVGFYLLKKSIKNCSPRTCEYDALDSSREINYGAAFKIKSHSTAEFFTLLSNCVGCLGSKRINFIP